MNGRSSDWLLISDAFPRSRYVESGSGNRYVSEILSEFHSSGTVRDLHPIPFSLSSTPGKERTKPAANITVLSEKLSESPDYFHKLPSESAGEGIPLRLARPGGWPTGQAASGLPGFPRSRKPPLVRMIERLLPFAQLFIKLQPQPGVVFDNIAHLLHTLQVHFQLLRRNVETKVVTRFDQKFL